MVFNATNVHVSINDRWLKDACSISWQQQASHEPIYGYMNERFRRVALGQGLIAGTIGIYFSEHDMFFRYLATAPGPASEWNTIVGIKQEEEKVRNAVRQSLALGDFVNIMSTVDLNSDTFLMIEAAAFEAAGLERPTPKVAGVNELYEDSDVVGRSGWEASYYRQRASTAGVTLKIHYGDAYSSQVVERLSNVYILGRSKSPIDNAPRAAGEAVMEYYSFIASHVEPAAPVRDI